MANRQERKAQIAAHERKAQIAAHASFYFITVILDTLRRKGLLSDDEIARAIDVYPHEDAAIQAETRAFLHRCMALIETVASSPSVAPSDDGHGDEAHSDARTDDAEIADLQAQNVQTMEEIARELRETVPHVDLHGMGSHIDAHATSIVADAEPAGLSEKYEVERRG